MGESTLYSIGHGNRSSNELLALLQKYEIAFLVDIRSMPYSKYNPHFNKENFERFLVQHDIKYIYLADQLGGLPKDRTCYDADGKVVYELVAQKIFFTEGLNRLINANEKRIKLAIMCSESKPQDCHRSKLIGKELRKKEINVNHIDENGRIKDQFEVINIATKGLGEQDLFGDRKLNSRKNTINYDPRILFYRCLRSH